jgi:AcrR family transcriptional regulator
LRAAIPDLRAGDPEVLRRITDAAAQDILGYSDPAVDTAVYAALAVAPRDAAAKSMLRRLYADLAAMYESVYPELAEATGRRFVREISPSDFSIAMTALADGILARHRFDPDPKLPELFAEVAVRLFWSVTVDQAILDEPTPADLLVPLPPGSALDPHKHQAIATAAAELYANRQRWEDVTIDSVAAQASVNRTTVTSHFGGRNGLAAIIWARHVPSIREVVKRTCEAGKAFDGILWSYVQRIAEIARIHNDVTGAYLHVLFSFIKGPSSHNSSADPRRLVLLPEILADEIRHHNTDLKAEFAGEERDAITFAEFVTNAAFLLTMNRKAMSSSQVADYIDSTVLTGAADDRT